MSDPLLIPTFPMRDEFAVRYPFHPLPFNLTKHGCRRDRFDPVDRRRSVVRPKITSFLTR